MLQRSLSSTGPALSVIGLGTWAIGGGDWKFGWGDQDRSAAIAAILRAVELGINWIDTAAVYGEGQSELLVGEALRQLPSDARPLVATKCGRVSLGNGEIGKCLRRSSIIAECDASLRRLGTETIDLYQLHWPEPDEEIEEGWQTLIDLKAQGKVREIGVSNHSVAQLQRLIPLHPVRSLQPPYSMIARDVEAELLPFCRQQDIGVICYSPLGKGLLTGSFSTARAENLSAKDHRSRDPRFQPPQLQINLAFVDALQLIASGLGWTLPELALAWTLRRPEVTAAIVGARSPQQIEQTAVAGSRILPADAAAAVAVAIGQRDQDLEAVGGPAKPRV
jgi:aryl-alcohol dehydrogenase-like predicted oxidoreductase